MSNIRTTPSPPPPDYDRKWMYSLWTYVLDFLRTSISNITFAGTANQVIKGNAAATSFEYATISGTAPIGVSFGTGTITISFSGSVAVANGGTGLSSGTSGGILGFTAAGTLASSAALTQHALVLGGGAGATPSTPVGLGTTTTVLHGNAAGDPTWAAVSLTADVSGTLPVGNGGTGITSLTANRIPYGNGSSPFQSSATLTFDGTTLTSGRTVISAARLLIAQGATVASANNLALGSDGNRFQISGTTGIIRIDNTNWQGGATVTLHFQSNLQVTHAGGASGNNKPISLQGGVNFNTAPGNQLVLQYDSTDATWYELSRKT